MTKTYRFMVLGANSYEGYTEPLFAGNKIEDAKEYIKSQVLYTPSEYIITIRPHDWYVVFDLQVLKEVFSTLKD